MKRYIFHFLLLLSSLDAFSQALPPLQPEQDACNALELCGTSFTTPYTYQGYGQIQNMAFGACITENNSMWMKITVASAGNIVFTITPINQYDDYDFAVIKLGTNTCSNFGFSNVVRCNGNNNNFGSTPGGIIGLNMTSTLTNVPGGTFGSPFCQYITAAAGDVYLIAIDNSGNYADPTSTPSGFTIDFTGSTATFNQPPAPKLASIAPACDKSGSIKVNLSKPVKCSSIAANGSDFTLTPSGTISSAVGVNCGASVNGYTSQITLTFASPLPGGSYVLHAATGTDNNTLLDICSSALQLPDTLGFTVAPNNLQISRLDTPACNKARIIINNLIKCSTVAANGSDFKITGPSAISVVGASPRSCNAQGMTDTIDLFFNKSIPVPGTYTLSVVTGTDGNQVNDTCGHSITNTISWVVSDRGLVSVTATPNILCAPGYVQLQGTPQFSLPNTFSGCGTNGTQITGATSNIKIGAGTTSTSSYMPFYQTYEGNRTQMLYTASELAAAGLKKGTISRIGFNITAKNSSYVYRLFTISIGCTSLSTLSGGYTTGLTTVFNPKNITTTAGVNMFTLDAPYDWDSTTNLVVEVCWNNNPGEWAGSDNIEYTSTAPNIYNYHKYKDNPNTGCAGLTNTTGNGGTSTNRANIYFTEAPYLQPTFDYKWSGMYIGDSTSPQTIAYVPETSVFKFQVLDSNRCYRRDEATVTVSERHPTLSPGRDTAFCIGNGMQLIAGGGTTYTWIPTDGLSCGNCPNPFATPLVTTLYSVVIADQYGCADTLSRTLTVHPLPVVDAGRDTTVIWGTPLQLYVYSPGGMWYQWDPGIHLNNPIIPNPVATPDVTTTYTVRVIDTNYCTSMDTVTVTVRTDVPVNIPTAFTPNGDGKNDVFRIGNMSIQRLQEFRVFNRWGQEIFTTTDASKGWDGTFNGMLQDTGDYQYLIRIAWPDGTTRMYKGDVTLVR